MKEEVAVAKSRLKALQKDLAAERAELAELKKYDPQRLRKNLDASKKKLAEKTTAADIIERLLYGSRVHVFRIAAETGFDPGLQVPCQVLDGRLHAPCRFGPAQLLPTGQRAAGGLCCVRDLQGVVVDPPVGRRMRDIGVGRASENDSNPALLSIAWISTTVSKAKSGSANEL